jgi:Flp pilus assembly protein TadB
MDEILSFITVHKLLAGLLVCGNIAPAALAVKRISRLRGRRVAESMGAGNEKLSLYGKCLLFASQAVRSYDRRGKKAGIYVRAGIKLKKAGYTGEYAPAVYLLLKYAAIPLFFILSSVVNYPDLKGPVIGSLALTALIELVIASEKRKINLKLQRYIYKIYKYLHNQVSSGIKVTDAVKTVYEVIDDRELRGMLIRLAARYELTLDIDTALEEFKAGFAAHEAETLCVALKQGIETGDNQELLARQEEVMFKKYFNYIQAETDGCKTRSMLSAAMFTAIVVIMIVVPLFSDAAEAVGSIFFN